MLGVLPSTFKPVNNLICCRTGYDVGGKMRNIAIQLVLQQCCKTSCTFMLPVFPRLKSDSVHQEGSWLFLACQSKSSSLGYGLKRFLHPSFSQKQPVPCSRQLQTSEKGRRAVEKQTSEERRKNRSGEPVSIFSNTQSTYYPAHFQKTRLLCQKVPCRRVLHVPHAFPCLCVGEAKRLGTLRSNDTTETPRKY